MMIIKSGMFKHAPLLIIPLK